MSFDVGILEEAAIIPESIMEAFAPILGVNNSVFLAITTPTEEDNYISQMFSNADADSKRLFARIHVEQWCRKCKESGVSARECVRMGHEKDRLPPWKASRNNEQVSKLLPKDELFASEVAGSIRARHVVFAPEWIKKLQDSQPVDLDARSIDTLFTFIDPSGGGMASELALVSVVWVPRKQWVVVIGISKSPCINDLEERAAVEAHHAALRKLPYLKANAENVAFVERNYGGGAGAGRILSHTHTFGPHVHRFCERFSAPGVTTNHDNQSEGVGLLCTELAAGNVHFARHMAYNTTMPKEQLTFRTTLCTQLGRFQRKLITKPNGTYSYKYTGKAGINAADDLAMSLCLLMYWAGVFIAQRQYTQHQANVAGQRQQQALYT